MAEPLDLHSPSAAFARQASMEARVEATLMWATRLFLADVEALALQDRTFMNAGQVTGAWSNRMSVTALSTRLPRDVAEYVAQMQGESVTPGEAYTTALAVMTAANERAWSAGLTSDVLATALSIDSPPVSLTAAAPDPNSKRGKAVREAFDQALRGQGASWAVAAKRDARTAVTGLDGIRSGAEMRATGVQEKKWVARRDKRVRESHAAADGQTVPLDEPFTVGGAPLMHPGDRNGPFAEVVNCRCVMVAVDTPAPKVDRSEADVLADEVYRLSVEREPAITAEMKALAQATGQRLEGLEYRLKEPGSLARKIANDAITDGVSLETAAANVSDGVRYTMITTEAKYTRGVQTTLDTLRAAGWQARVKNAWAQKDRAYQGINVALTSPTGQAVELQFHTQPSFDAKMADEMHGTYEKQRVLPKSDPQWAVYEKAMHDFMARVPVPRGVTTVG